MRRQHGVSVWFRGCGASPAQRYVDRAGQHNGPVRRAVVAFVPRLVEVQFDDFLLVTEDDLVDEPERDTSRPIYAPWRAPLADGDGPEDERDR